MGRDAERSHQAKGIGFGAAAGRKTGHGVSQDVFPGQAEPVHGSGGDDKRVGRVQSAGDADDDALNLCAGEPLHQAMHLNVVCFVAPLVPLAGVIGNVGKAFQGTEEGNLAFRCLKFKRDAADFAQALFCGPQPYHGNWSGAFVPEAVAPGQCRRR